MGLYYYGLQATNPAYSVVFLNLIPIVTFVIAIVVGYANNSRTCAMYNIAPSVQK
jgi:drug/metabolite transporter (DMT)-like permease